MPEVSSRRRNETGQRCPLIKSAKVWTTTCECVYLRLKFKQFLKLYKTNDLPSIVSEFHTLCHHLFPGPTISLSDDDFIQNFRRKVISVPHLIASLSDKNLNNLRSFRTMEIFYEARLSRLSSALETKSLIKCFFLLSTQSKAPLDLFSSTHLSVADCVWWPRLKVLSMISFRNRQKKKSIARSIVGSFVLKRAIHFGRVYGKSRQYCCHIICAAISLKVDYMILCFWALSIEALDSSSQSQRCSL